MDIFDRNIEGIWRQRVQGPGGNPWVFFLLLFSFTSLAEESWTEFRPYVPEKWDYSFSLGSSWERNNLYWMGASVGRHLGPCVFSQSQTCQNYLDAIIGVAGRDGQTNGYFLLAPRWQFVSWPQSYSPFVRVFAGMINYRDNERDKEQFAYGLSYGITSSVHERVDLGLEARVGGGDRVWSVVLFSVHLKMDQWLSYFAERIKDFGGTAASVTGSVIKGTLKTSGEIMGTVMGKPVKSAADAIFNSKDKSKENPPKQKPGNSPATEPQPESK